MYVNDSYLAIYYANYAQGDKEENYKKAVAVATQMEGLYPDTNSEEYKYAENIRSQLQSAIDKYEKAKNAPPAKTTPTKSGTSKPKGKQ